MGTVRAFWPNEANAICPMKTRSAFALPPEAILLAYGFKIEMLAGLVLDGFATAAPETVPAGGRQLKVVRMMITDAGRGAIAGF
jgi:hypothetical protein